MEILETHGKKMENIKITCRKQGFLSNDLCKTTILRFPWPAHKMQSVQKTKQKNVIFFCFFGFPISIDCLTCNACETAPCTKSYQ